MPSSRTASHLSITIEVWLRLTQTWFLSIWIKYALTKARVSCIHLAAPGLSAVVITTAKGVVFGGAFAINHTVFPKRAVRGGCQQV
jgi:hypothetical protein